MKQRNIIVLATALLFSFSNNINGQQKWQMKPVPLQTRWAKPVSPNNALTEYPRPQMVRESWDNLDGLWSYSITEKNAPQPREYNGAILVPYPLESALSGVKKSLQPDQNLWYKRTFEQPRLKSGEHLLLHFGAVDWQATVFVNGNKVAMHQGGYTAFDADITNALKSGNNELVVKVFDPTDEGIGPHGKQVLNPQNIYYTSTSGIWQTVWLEVVPKDYIQSLTITPNVDSGFVAVTVHSNKTESVKLSAAGKTISSKTNDLIKLPIASAHLWSPADPYLYDLTIKTKSDEVKSYFGMRKVSIAKDEKGIDRIFLNNKFYYNLGVLDQGFWPDGLYTAPTDEALAFDIKAIKAMGFNTIRKHIKVEPARWYYWADKLGMLVWQDMVNPNQGLPEGAKQAFEQQCKETLDQLHNYPCITTWVLFNEKWGQYDQQRLTEWIKKTDPSRIVNGHTGEMLYVNEQLRSPSPNAYVSADMTDVHSYPDPLMPIKQSGKAQVLGEFGGIGVFIPDHQWNSSSAWGYIQEKPADLETKYRIMNQHLELLERDGLSGSIYTQPYDVEGEQNGLMTYDREIVKVPLEKLREIHKKLNPDMGIIPDVSIKDADLSDPASTYSHLLQDYINGNRAPLFLKKLAMMAAQAGDKPGAAMAGKDYIATLHAPLSEDEVEAVTQFTKSTRDLGFSLMTDNSEQFRKVLGDRKFTVAQMNVIYHGEIEPLLNSSDKPDWNAIKEHIKPYGLPGEEIYLRARTIGDYNNQDWIDYVPVASEYLEKFGKNISADENRSFQDAINEHKAAQK